MDLKRSNALSAKKGLAATCCRLHAGEYSSDPLPSEDCKGFSDPLWLALILFFLDRLKRIGLKVQRVLFNSGHEKERVQGPAPIMGCC
jgi:hypothetical protein